MYSKEKLVRLRLINTLTHLHDYVGLVSSNWTKNGLKHKLAKLSLKATIYFIWGERNSRIFTQVTRDTQNLIIGIKFIMSERALSIKKINFRADDETII